MLVGSTPWASENRCKVAFSGCNVTAASANRNSFCASTLRVRNKGVTVDVCLFSSDIRWNFRTEGDCEYNLYYYMEITKGLLQGHPLESPPQTGNTLSLSVSANGSTHALLYPLSLYLRSKRVPDSWNNIASPQMKLCH